MLRLRRAELEIAMAAAAARLVQVEARLRSIESEGHMPTNDVVIKNIPAVRVAELTATAASYEPEDIGPVIGPLYDELFRRLDAAGVAPAGPGVAYYEDAPEGGGRISIHAAVQVAAPLQDGAFRVFDLPPIDEAATIVHRGSMDTVLPTAQALAFSIDENGYQSAGYPREISLECPDNRDDWVTELQAPVTKPCNPGPSSQDRAPRTRASRPGSRWSQEVEEVLLVLAVDSGGPPAGEAVVGVQRLVDLRRVGCDVGPEGDLGHCCSFYAAGGSGAVDGVQR
ncbi:hypothetical protein SALBM311S_05781 [Streptomyces alboniger]